MLRIYGSGDYSFYTGTSTFSSPADDNGTLTLTGGTYTYTAPDGETETFNSSGYETQWTSADGQETLQFRYNGSNQLTGMTAIDGGLTTFSYSSGLLPPSRPSNSRTYTLAYAGTNLTQITEPRRRRAHLQLRHDDEPAPPDRRDVRRPGNEWAYNGSSGALATITGAARPAAA